MRAIQEDSELELQVVATGMHISSEQGETWKQIEAEGFPIHAKVDIDISEDSPLGIARSTALALSGTAKILEQIKPDAVVVLGDRYEILGAAEACLLLRIPLAHIHGGEVTEGAIDDSIRHAITKMAYWHFAAAEPYRTRIIQMGESPERVWNVGALGHEGIKNTPKLSVEEFERRFFFRFQSPGFLITYHPATLETTSAENQCRQFLAALDAFPEATLLFTKANSDMGGRIINQMIESYVDKRSKSGKATRLVSALGREGYLSALRLCDVVVGNSSSGIIEAPFFGKPTVNIGLRQQGRLLAKSIISSGVESTEITEAIRHALSEKFRTQASAAKSPYDQGETSNRIVKILKSELSKGFPDGLRKTFYDV